MTQGHRRLVALSLAAVLLFTAFWGLSAQLRKDDPAEILDKGRRELIQGRPAAAAALFRQLVEKVPTHAEGRILLARALLQDGHADEATTTLLSAVEIIPASSPWRDRARFLLAAAAEKRGDAAEASSILEAEATRVDGREARLAIAARLAAIGHELLEPKAPLTDPLKAVPAPDPAKAAVFFAEAAAIHGATAEGADADLLAADCLIRSRSAAKAIGIADRLIGRCEPEGKTPDSGILAKALYLKGRAQIDTGDLQGARRSLSRLAEMAEAAGIETLDIDQGRSFGLPKTTDPRAVEAGAVHWRRFLERRPGHGRAEEVGRELAEAYFAAQMTDDCERAAREWLNRHGASPKAPNVLLLIASARELKGDLAGTREVLREFLGRFPDDPAAPDARRRLPDLHFTEAVRTDPSSAADAALLLFSSFEETWPADPRAPQAAVQIGRLHAAAKRFDPAFTVWRAAAERYSRVDPANAALAALLAASLSEEERKDLEAAVSQYRELIQRFQGTPSAAEAQARIARLEAVELELEDPPVFRSGEAHVLTLTMRNVPKAALRLYPIDIEAWFRSKRSHSGFESLDVTLVKAARKIDLEPQTYRRYVQEKREVPLSLDDGGKPLAPGAYVVTVEDGERRARVVVLVSDLAVTVKQGPRQVFVFAEDLAKGRPVEKARVLLVQDGQLVEEGATDADGVWKKDFEKDAESRDVLVVSGDQAAPGCIGGVRRSQGFSFAPKGWLTVDRPVYRVAETVNLHGILRRGGIQDWSLPEAGTKLAIEVFDAGGRLFDRREVSTEAMGSFSASVELPAEARRGRWRAVCRDGDFAFECAFDVADVQRAEYAITVAPENDSGFAFRPGAKVPVVVRVADFFGRPVRNARVSWFVWAEIFAFDPMPLEAQAWYLRDTTRPVRPSRDSSRDQRGEAITDEQGTCRFVVETDAGAVSHRMNVQATVIADEQNAQQGYGVFHVARDSFAGLIRSAGKSFRAGDLIQAEVITTGLGLRPVSRTGTLALMLRRPGAKDEVELGRATVSTGVDGHGTATLPVTETGDLRLVFSAEGEHGETVRLERAVMTVSEGYDPDRDLRLEATRRIWQVGDEMTAHLDLPRAGRPVLLTMEDERVIDYRVVYPGDRHSTIRWRLEARHAPNVFVNASMVDGRDLRRASDEIQVFRWLDVSIEADREDHAPGETVKLAIRTRDQSGRPVAAELGLAVVDRAQLELAPEGRPDIRAFFYKGRREHRVETSSSEAFLESEEAQLLDRDLLERRRREEVARDQERYKSQFDKLEDKSRVASRPDAPTEGGFLGLAGGAGGGKSAESQEGRNDRKDNSNGAVYGAPAAPKAEDADDESAADAKPGLRRARRGGEKSKQAQAPATSLSLEVPSLIAGFVAAEPEIEVLRERLIQFDAHDQAILFADEANGPDPLGSADAPRQRILPVAFFDPRVRTDAEGKATVEFRLPDNVTEWRVQAIGVTSGTEVGEGARMVRARKDIEASIVAPSYLVAGDRTTIGVRVESRTSEDLDLTTTIAAEGPLTIDGETSAASRLDGMRDLGRSVGATAGRLGSVQLSVRAEGGGRSDAILREIRVLPFGRTRSSGGSGRFVDEAILDFERGQDVIDGTLSAVLVVSGGSVSDLLGAAAWLTLRSADGLAEVAGRTLALMQILDLEAGREQKLPLSRDAITALIRGDLNRLVAARSDDGSFAWCKGAPGDPYVTALALEALREGQKRGLIGEAAALRSTIDAAQRMAESSALDGQAALVHALAGCGELPVNAFNRLSRSSAKLSTSGLAWLAMAASRSGREAPARELQSAIESRLQREKGLVFAKGRTEISWLADEVETTAWVLMALSEKSRSGPDLDGLVAYLRSRRRSACFGGSKATATVVQALAVWARGRALDDSRSPVSVYLGDEKIGEIGLAATGGLGSSELSLPADRIAAGRNRLKLRASASQPIYYSLAVNWMEPSESLAAEPGTFSVDRRLIDWQRPEERRLTQKPGYSILRVDSRPPIGAMPGLDEVIAERRYEVILELRSTEPEDYVVVEEPLPAGLAFFDAPVEGEFADFERREDRLVFRFPHLQAGVTSIRYSVFATAAGRYRAMPTVAYRQLERERRGSSAALSLTVLPAGQAQSRLDPMKETPDWKLGLARRAFERKAWSEVLEIARPLLALELDDAAREQISRLLVLCDLRTSDWKQAVKDFEGGFVDESALDSEELRLLGRAFREVGDHERAKQFYARVIAGAFSRALVPVERMNEIGRRVEAVDYGLNVARGFGDTAEVLETWASLAESFFTIPDENRRDAAGLPAAQRMSFERGIDEFEAVMSHAAGTPLAEDLALRRLDHLGALGFRDRADRAAEDFLERHPESTEADEAAFVRMRATFARGEFAAAGKVAASLLESRWNSLQNGRLVAGRSRHTAEATEVLGRIAHVEGRLSDAVRLYGEVKDQFPDAMQSWLFFTEKHLETAALQVFEPGTDVTMAVRCKNLTGFAWSAYSIDLPLVFTVRKSLANLAQVDLTGVKPDAVGKVEGLQTEWSEKECKATLGALAKGAWLVVLDAGDRRVSSVLVVSDLKLELRRNEGDLRVFLTDGTRKPVAGAEIRVGDGSRILATVRTDERGIAVLSDLPAPVTVLASKDNAAAVAGEN